MRLEIDGTKYRLWWRYERGESRVYITAQLQAETGGVINVGLSSTPAWAFVCERQRKLTLARALSTAGFAKPTRRLIWQQYFARGMAAKSTAIIKSVMAEGALC